MHCVTMLKLCASIYSSSMHMCMFLQDCAMGQGRPFDLYVCLVSHCFYCLTCFIWSEEQEKARAIIFIYIGCRLIAVTVSKHIFLKTDPPKVHQVLSLFAATLARPSCSLLLFVVHWFFQVSIGNWLHNSNFHFFNFQFAISGWWGHGMTVEAWISEWQSSPWTMAAFHFILFHLLCSTLFRS